MAHILVVDDEMGIRELLSEILEDENHHVSLASNAAIAKSMYASTEFDLVLLDIWMPDTDGMTLLRDWIANGPLQCPVVMMSGHASMDTAVEAQALGATAFLEKPITLAKLLSTIKKAIERHETHKAFQSAIGSNPELLAKVTSAFADEANVFDTSLEVMTKDSQGLALPSAKTLHSDDANPQAYAQAPLAHDADNSFVPNQWTQALEKISFDQTLREFREQTELLYFQYLMHREQGSVTRLSESAGLERTHLYRKLKQLKIEIIRRPKP